QLTAALGASPLLRRRDQRATDPVSTSLRHDEPSFDVRHTVAAAAFGVRANRHFHEAERTSCPVLGKKDRERLARVAGEEPGDLLPVLGCGILGPEAVAQLKPRGSVPRYSGSNRDHCMAAAERMAPRWRSSRARALR